MRKVPLDNNVYPYDVVRKQKQHVKTLVNYQNRRKWQTLIKKDLINPNKKFGRSLANEEGQYELKMPIQPQNERNRFPSHIEKRHSDVKTKYNRYANEKLAFMYRAATAAKTSTETPSRNTDYSTINMFGDHKGLLNAMGPKNLQNMIKEFSTQQNFF